MKRIAPVILAVVVPLLSAQEPIVPVAPVKVTQRIIYNSDKPIEPHERQKALAMRNVCALLGGVTDTATADVAAAEVLRNMQVLRGQGAPLPDEPVTGQQAVDYHTAVVEAEKKQRAAFYHGSTALATALGVPAAWATIPTDMQMAAARENLKAIRETVLLLSNVVDDRSAAAAAPEVRRLRELMAGLEQSMSGLDITTVMMAAGLEEGELMYIPMCLERLRLVNVYGCEELAAALGLPIEIAHIPGELTDAELGKLCYTLLQRRAAAADKLPGVSGGPGLKDDEPWVLDCTPEVRQAFMEIVLQGAKLEYCEKVEGGEKLHLLMPWEGKEVKLELWVR
ncbi:MAG: hypothetical protein IJ503_00905 [Akkermansia sp.]|nr:hypothetical protein [Akkermansia sp.]